jgi:hypothetical protein
VGIVILIFALPWIIKKWKQSEKQRRSEELMRSDPAAYVRLRQIEHEERMMEHDRRRLANDRLKVGMSIGSFILKILTKR